MNRYAIPILLALYSCSPANSNPPPAGAVEGRCVLFPHDVYSPTANGWRTDTTRVRLTSRGVSDPAFQGWRIVEPGIGLNYTYWRSTGRDSVRIVWSNNVMDGTTLDLAVTDDGLVGTTRTESDVVTDLDRPRPIRLPWAPCP